MEKKRGSFTGGLGFVLAAAGSAVGLGNLWRFPYLAAKHGGGVFLFVYILLALTFGFTLMITEIAIGRKTGRSAIRAYAQLNKNFKFLGYLASVIPFVIFAYYCVIGGWVMKYMADFMMGNGMQTVADGYFQGFMTSLWSPIFWMAVFMLISAVIVYLGVDKGVEKFSKIFMPVLFVLIIGIAVFTMTLKGPHGTAFEGLAIYLIPDFTGMTVGKFFTVLLDAAGQIFYSMSIAMGIMITYGSYMPKDTNLVKSVNQIEICDTGVALLAGMIMVPTVFIFQGVAGLEQSGPGLLFIALPKVFEAMGFAGNFVGVAFFLLVAFAALTSSVSLLEAVVSIVVDQVPSCSRKKACTYVLVLSLVLACITCLGYNVFYFEYTLPNGVTGQLLDIMDYVSNNVLMPIVALATCILAGWVLKPKEMIDEIKSNGESFDRERIYAVMLRYIAPFFLILIFLSAFLTA